MRLNTHGTLYQFALITPSWREPLDGVPNYCRVLYAEMSATQAAANIFVDKYVPKRKITILSDSRSAIWVLNSNIMNSKTVYDYRRYLNDVMDRYDVISSK